MFTKYIDNYSLNTISTNDLDVNFYSKGIYLNDDINPILNNNIIILGNYKSNNKELKKHNLCLYQPTDPYSIYTTYRYSLIKLFNENTYNKMSHGMSDDINTNVI